MLTAPACNPIVFWGCEPSILLIITLWAFVAFEDITQLNKYTVKNDREEWALIFS
jgi:hypothetical protein